MGHCIDGQARSLRDELLIQRLALAQLPFRIGANDLRSLCDPSRSNGSSAPTKEPSAAAIAVTTVEFIVRSLLACTAVKQGPCRTSASGCSADSLSVSLDRLSKRLANGRDEMAGRTAKCKSSTRWRDEREVRRCASGRACQRTRYSGREMPSFFIFQHNVERFIPRRAAAPFGPPTTQPVSRRAPRMCSRSASASVSLEVGGSCHPRPLSRRRQVGRVSIPSSAAGFSPPTSDPWPSTSGL